MPVQRHASDTLTHQANDLLSVDREAERQREQEVQALKNKRLATQKDAQETMQQQEEELEEKRRQMEEEERKVQEEKEREKEEARKERENKIAVDDASDDDFDIDDGLLGEDMDLGEW